MCIWTRKDQCRTSLIIFPFGEFGASDWYMRVFLCFSSFPMGQCTTPCKTEARTPNGPRLQHHFRTLGILADPLSYTLSLPKVSKICFFPGESSSPTPPTPREPTDPLNRVDRSPQTDMRNTCAKMINKELVDAGEQSSTFAENRGNPMEFERIPGFRPPSPPIGFPNLIFKARSESTILLGTYKTL